MTFSWDFGIAEELRLVEERILRAIVSDEPLLTEIAHYMISAGGKRIRPTVVLLSFRALGGTDARQAIEIAASLELIHSATLLHDDINDRGEFRRGWPTAYRKFGLQEALVAGDFLFTKAFGIGGKFEEDIVDITADVCATLAEGEIRQKRRARDVAITKADYLDIIRRKTARPIGAGARVGGILAGGGPAAIEAVAEYGEHLGMAFQIVDDILDVVGDKLTLGKRPGTDIKEGLVTLPAIHALNDGVAIDRSELIRILRKREKPWGEVESALRMLRDCGAPDRAHIEAVAFSGRAKAALRPIASNPFKDELLRLADFVVARDR